MSSWLLALGLALAGPEAPPNEPPSDSVIHACDEAVDARDEAALQSCVETWVLSDPRNPETDWYAFHLAMVQENTTAAEAARQRAMARGLDPEKAKIIKRMGLPPNPLLALQKWFLGGVLALGLGGMLWARYRHMAHSDIRESAEAEQDG